MAIENDEPTEVPPLYIRERMKALGITGEKLAELMNTTPATVSRLLNGKRQMSLGWLFAFARALNTPIEMLFSQPGTITLKSPESDLRSSLLAFGVEAEDLGRAISAVKVFLDDPDEQSSQDPLDDQSELSSRRHEPVPSGKRPRQRAS